MYRSTFDSVIGSKDNLVCFIELFATKWTGVAEKTDKLLDLLVDTICLPVAIAWLLFKKILCKCLRLPTGILKRWKRMMLIFISLYILYFYFPDVVSLNRWAPFPKTADDHVSWDIGDITNITTETSQVFVFTPCVPGDIRQTYAIMKTARLMTSNQTSLIFYVLGRWNVLEMITNWFSGWSKGAKENVYLRLRNVNMHLADQLPCNMIKLLIPMLIPEDLIIYMDPNHIFLAPPSDLWRHFDYFESSTFIASGSKSLAEKVATGKVADLDLDFGIILMNLTKFRESGYPHLIQTLTPFVDFPPAVSPDHHILHSVLSLMSATAVVLPCKWNYSPQHCNGTHRTCNDVINSGAHIIKGSDMAFVDPHAVPPFFAVQRVLLVASIKVDMYHILIPRIQDTLLSGFLQNAGTSRETRIPTLTHPCGRDIQTYTFHLEKYCRDVLKCHQM